VSQFRVSIASGTQNICHKKPQRGVPWSNPNPDICKKVYPNNRCHYQVRRPQVGQVQGDRDYWTNLHTIPSLLSIHLLK